MTGRPPPPDDELRARILKRLADIDDQGYVPRVRHSGLVAGGIHLTGRQSQRIDIMAADVAYMITIQIGTPARDYPLGSGDTWVGSESCQTFHVENKTVPVEDGIDCGNHILLGPRSSSSFIDTGVSFQEIYGSGAVLGTIVQGDFTIAGFTLKAHTFGAAYLETMGISDSSVPSDGLIGLAKSNMSNQKVLTPVEALAEQGQIQEPITSYMLPRAVDKKNDGEIMFGAVNTTKFDSTTQVVLESVDPGGWEVQMDAISVDGQDVQLFTQLMARAQTRVRERSGCARHPLRRTISVRLLYRHISTKYGQDSSSLYVIY